MIPPKSAHPIRPEQARYAMQHQPEEQNPRAT
jgi:hypothetical protein